MMVFFLEWQRKIEREGNGNMWNKFHQIGVVILLLLVMVTGCTPFKSKVETISELIDQKKYSEAVQVYEKNKRVVSQDNMENMIAEKVGLIKDKYLKGELNFSAAHVELNELKKIQVNIDAISQVASLITKIDNSKNDYKVGKDLYMQKKYKLAYEKMKKVIKE